MKEYDSEQEILEFRSVSFKYAKKEEYLLNKVNLKILPGDKVGIIGENGCGKSTLAKLILGLLRPSDGKIMISAKENKWYKHLPEIGYIGDPGYSSEMLGLPLEKTVEETLVVTKYLNNTSVGRLNSLINLLNIESFRNKKIKLLSTGQRKRLMAALTFLRSPYLIILDEPFDGLDSNTKVALSEMIHNYLDDHNKALLLISHSLSEIDTFTDKVYKLEEGILLPSKQWSFNLSENLKGIEENSVMKSGEIIGWFEKEVINKRSSLSSDFRLTLRVIDENRY